MRKTGLALAVVALGTLGSGCGGGSGSGADSSDAIAVRDFEFAPSSYTTAAGEKVVWENEGEQIHNVKGKGFFSRSIDAGESYSFTFDRAGSYDYLCTLHPQMKGTIAVE
jgi:plastocyanin